MKLVFASHNKHKAAEIAKALPAGFQLLTLDDVGFFSEIEETGISLEENALIKAKTVFNVTGKPCFADDTGLEVEALDGAPGVYSARFAGEKATYKDNCDLLLQRLQDNPERKAAFRTVFCLIEADGAERFFQGRVDGTITTEFFGENGFGYDPIFKPDEATETFAQMSLEQKNKISHRGRALAKLLDYIKKHYV